MALFLEPQTRKQGEIRDAIEKFLDSDSILVLPTIGGGKFEYHMNDIAIAMDTFYDALDKAVGLIHDDAAARGTPVTCSSGCDYCCFQPVSCSLLEAMFIVTHLDGSKEKQEHFFSRYKEWRKKVDAPGYSELMNNEIKAAVAGENNDDSRIMKFVKSNRAECPFLEDSACSIYSARPSICRALLSIDGVEKCKKSEVAQMAMGKTLQKLMEEKQPQLYSQLMESFGIGGMICSPMPLAVYEIFNGRKNYLELCVKEARAQFGS